MSTHSHYIHANPTHDNSLYYADGIRCVCVCTIKLRNSNTKRLAKGRVRHASSTETCQARSLRDPRPAQNVYATTAWSSRTAKDKQRLERIQGKPATCPPSGACSEVYRIFLARTIHFMSRHLTQN